MNYELIKCSCPLFLSLIHISLAGFSERFESTEDFLSQLSLLGNTDDESAAADLSGCLLYTSRCV